VPVNLNSKADSEKMTLAYLCVLNYSYFVAGTGWNCGFEC